MLHLTVIFYASGVVSFSILPDFARNVRLILNNFIRHTEVNGGQKIVNK